MELGEQTKQLSANSLTARTAEIYWRGADWACELYATLTRDVTQEDVQLIAAGFSVTVDARRPDGIEVYLPLRVRDVDDQSAELENGLKLSVERDALFIGYYADLFSDPAYVCGDETGWEWQRVPNLGAAANLKLLQQHVEAVSRIVPIESATFHLPTQRCRFAAKEIKLDFLP